MLLKLENIIKSYGKENSPGYQVVLRGLSFQMDEGDTVAILGPSGSGKSTLLNILGTLDWPDKGLYKYKDQDITGYSVNDIDHFRNREIGFVFQSHHLLPQCTVLENVLIPTLVGEGNPAEQKSYAENLLEKVGLKDHLEKFPGQLSGGECQRVAVVRAMINKPSLLLADEPTGALDKKNVVIMADLLLTMQQEFGAALLLVTHSESLAKSMNKIYNLEEGKLSKL